MRRKKNEMTDMAEVEGVLRSAGVLHLALNAADAPYVLPLSYGVEPGKIYFHCAKEGLKLDLIRACDKVGFSVEADVRLKEPAESGVPGEPCEYGVRFKSVIGTGTARIVEDPEEKVHGLQLVMDHYAPGDWRFSEHKLAITAVVCIEIATLSGKKSGY